MMSLPKTVRNSGKMRISEEPKKIYIVGNVLMRATQKCNFYCIWATVSKVMGLLSNLSKPLTKYGHVTWLWHQILKIFNFRPISVLNFRKSYYISVLKNSIEYSFVCFKYFIIHRLGDWNRSCTLSLFWGQFCMEKLYGELIECIIRAYRVNRYDNCPVNFFFSSCVIRYEGTQRTSWIANSD